MQPKPTDPDVIRQLVRDNYAKIADAFGSSRSAGENTACCSGEGGGADGIGYTRAQIASVPETANMGLGCGNPQAIARLKPGETVLDLGSGAGFDCLLAAQAVGPTGRVIGVDMTENMIRKARRNADLAGIGNVEYRIAEIEHLPLADESVDVIISNCVINLSPEKEAVFREAYRVLNPGGRLAISDVAATRPLPAAFRQDSQMRCACIGGAALIADLQGILQIAGFERIVITPLAESRELIRQWVPGKNAQNYIVSVLIEAEKPRIDRLR
jgi:arsenite methyltransferase